jgi:hypothetical protein
MMADLFFPVIDSDCSLPYYSVAHVWWHPLMHRSYVGQYLLPEVYYIAVYEHHPT